MGSKCRDEQDDSKEAESKGGNVSEMESISLSTRFTRQRKNLPIDDDTSRIISVGSWEIRTDITVRYTATIVGHSGN